jgi:hypothetical protein
MAKSWREYAKPIIKQVLKDTAGQPEKVIRKALKEAYPFGLRQYHPYKIWLDEIKVQRGKRKFNARKSDVIPENQTNIF